MVRGDGEKNKNLYGTPERDRDSKRELETEKDMVGGNRTLEQCLYSRTFCNDENIMHLLYPTWQPPPHLTIGYLKGVEYN